MFRILALARFAGSPRNDTRQPFSSPPPPGPRLRAPGRRLLWGRDRAGGLSDLGDDGDLPERSAFVRLNRQPPARPPSSVLPHKGGGGATATLAGFALVAFALGIAPAFADAPPVCAGKDLTDIAGLADARARRADDLVNGEGLLWRIDKATLAPSYLFGTIHSTDDGAIALAKTAAEEIPQAKIVVTELGSLDAVAKANAAASMLARALDRDHDAIADAPAEDRDAIEGLVRNLGYPVDLARHLKLWFLAILTASPQCEVKRQQLDLPEVDQFLADEAKSEGVKVVALETADEQIDAIASLRPEAAATLLAVSARRPEMNDDVYATLVTLYRESRPAEILAIGDAIGGMSDEERAAENELTARLLTARNAIMADRLAPLLKDGGAFVAVGALHLSGKDGLIERLRAMGYNVTKVW